MHSLRCHVHKNARCPCLCLNSVLGGEGTHVPDVTQKGLSGVDWLWGMEQKGRGQTAVSILTYLCILRTVSTHTTSAVTTPIAALFKCKRDKKALGNGKRVGAGPGPACPRLQVAGQSPGGATLDFRMGQGAAPW